MSSGMMNTVINFSHSWLVDNVDTCVKTRTTVCHSTDRKIKWRITLTPDDDLESFSLEVTLLTWRSISVRGKFKVYLTNPNNEPVNVFETPNLMTFEFGKVIIFPKFLDRKSLFGEVALIPPNNSVIIYFAVKMLYSETTEMDNILELSNDLDLFLSNSVLPDVIISTGDKKLEAHRAVLSARSNVFAAMFKHQTAENLNSLITIDDVDYEVLKEMLKFIYTGKMPASDNAMAIPLLAAADKYELLRLRKICEETVVLNLCKDSAAETLILSDLHSVFALKAHTVEFILTHSLDVMETDGWKKMLSTHSYLMQEVFRELAIRFNNIINTKGSKRKYQN